MERHQYLFLSGLKLFSGHSEQDSVSISFDDGLLAVFSPIEISGFETDINAAEAAQFLSGCTVLDAYSDQDRLNLDFGGVYLHISLKPEDYLGSHAACWNGNDGKTIPIK